MGVFRREVRKISGSWVATRCLDTVNLRRDVGGRTGSRSRRLRLTSATVCGFHLKKQRSQPAASPPDSLSGLCKHGRRFISVIGWTLVSHKHWHTCWFYQQLKTNWCHAVHFSLYTLHYLTSDGDYIGFIAGFALFVVVCLLFLCFLCDFWSGLCRSDMVPELSFSFFFITLEEAPWSDCTVVGDGR